MAEDGEGVSPHLDRDLDFRGEDGEEECLSCGHQLHLPRVSQEDQARATRMPTDVRGRRSEVTLIVTHPPSTGGSGITGASGAGGIVTHPPSTGVGVSSVR